MKYIFRYLILFFLLLSLCGCQSIALYREPEQQYLVSAIGFDRVDENLKVSLEVIIFSVGKADSSIEAKVFCGVGQTVKQAIGNLSGEVAKKLLYSHCVLIVLGESLSSGQTNEIFEYCCSGKDIPISAAVISTPAAEELLSCKSLSTPVTGYDITGVTKQKSQDWGIGLQNRLYEVEGKRLLQNSYYAVPYFTVKVNDDDTNYLFNGIRIYENDMPSLLFSLPESALFCLLTDSYQSGTFYFESDGNIYQPEVKKAATSVSADDNGKLHITISMRLELEREQTDTIDTEALSEALRKKATEFFIAAGDASKTDIFNVEKRIIYTGQKEDNGTAEFLYSDVEILFDIKLP